MIPFMQIYQNKNVKLLGVVAVLLGMVLFPYGWLSNNWWVMRWIENTFFEAEWSHWLGHMVMYGTLATAVLIVFPQLLKRPYHYFGLIFAIGLAQETLQLLTFKHHFFTTNELFDLIVDLLAAGIVFAIGKFITQKRNGRNIYAFKNTRKQ